MQAILVFSKIGLRWIYYLIVEQMCGLCRIITAE